MRATSIRAKRGKLVHAIPELDGAGAATKTLCGKTARNWHVVDASMSCLKCLNRLLVLNGGIKEDR